MSDQMAVATDQAMQDSGITEQPSNEGSFFDVDFGDEKLSFKSKDELSKWAKESAMRQKDYTKKTQTIAAQRREFEQRQKEHQSKVEKELEAIKQAKSKWEKYDQAFKARPHIYQQMERLVSQPSSPDEVYERTRGYADEQMKAIRAELDSLKAEKERERMERSRDEVYSRLGERYQDFDKDAVDQMLNTLEEGNLEPLLEMAYRASRYGTNGTEAKVIEKLQRKQGAKISAGGAGPPPPRSGSSNLNEAHAEAMRDAGLL